MAATMLPPVLLFASLILGPRPTGAQPSGSSSSGSGGYTVKLNPAVAAIVMSLVLVFFFLGFFSVYFRRCSPRISSSGRGGVNEGDGSGVNVRRPGRRGLDKEVLETFPTMAYSKAKELKSGEEALECAVCLSEFADDDVLRLLPSCSHVFHVDCIDVWLDSHVTCPVCRFNLGDPAVATADEAPAVGSREMALGEEGNGGLEDGDLEAGRATPPAAIRRWNSTGHEAEAVDRFTLRLPEQVRREILAAGRYRRASSLTVVPDVGDTSVRRSGGGLGGLSGRWRFLWRTMSMRRWAEAPTAAEGSSKRIFPMVHEAQLEDRVGGGGGAAREGHDPSSKESSTMEKV